MESLIVNGKSYPVLKLLGKGKGGYSYLALDGTRKVVVKQIHHEPCDYYQFGDKLASELRDYRRLHDLGLSMPELLDVDKETERLVKEYIEGPTVFELVRDGVLPAGCLEQVEQMSALLYPARLNIDWFPTNFVLQDGTLFYIDYECNDYMEQWDFAHWGVKYWSQTPEFFQYINQQGRGAAPPDREEA